MAGGTATPLGSTKAGLASSVVAGAVLVSGVAAAAGFVSTGVAGTREVGALA